MFDNLALEAIISDPEYAKANMNVGISASNPKRIDMSTDYKNSANTNIISIDLNFGFYFGELSAA